MGAVEGLLEQELAISRLVDRVHRAPDHRQRRRHRVAHVKGTGRQLKEGARDSCAAHQGTVSGQHVLLEYRSGDPFSTPWDKSSSSWHANVLRLDPAVQKGRTGASPEERALKPDPRSQF